jgi:hypothetical protein
MSWSKIDGSQPYTVNTLYRDRRIPKSVEASFGMVGVRRWGLMPTKDPPSWISVVVKIALDWRFLIALAILARVLLNR